MLWDHWFKEVNMISFNGPKTAKLIYLYPLQQLCLLYFSLCFCMAICFSCMRKYANTKFIPDFHYYSSNGLCPALPILELDLHGVAMTTNAAEKPEKKIKK